VKCMLTFWYSSVYLKGETKNKSKSTFARTKTNEIRNSNGKMILLCVLILSPEDV